MTDPTRRALLRRIGCAAAVCALPGTALARPLMAVTSAPEPRRLRFYHTHTRSRLELAYHDGDRYLPDALERIDVFLRDFRTRDVHPIDPGLLDILSTMQSTFGPDRRFEVISGYRSPITNEHLRSRTDGVAKASLHMQGRAIDVRLAGVNTNQLRRAATDLGRGGVGYYPESDFVHLDTGRFRTW